MPQMMGGEDATVTGSSSIMDDLDDALPPSLRTAKAIAKKLGTNVGARSACTQIAAGEKLTRAQKKSLFRLGEAEGIDKRAMVTVVKQSERLGVEPSELAALGKAAVKAKVPPSMVRATLRALPRTRIYMY